MKYRDLLLLAWLAGNSLTSVAYAGTNIKPSESMDPTRPPDELMAKSESSPSSDGKPVSAGAGLQAIVLRKGAKPMAVINGETVWLGGKVGDARLVKLGETDVELDGPNGKEVMRMTPAVEKKMIPPPGVLSPQKQRKVKRARTSIDTHEQN